MGTVENVHFIKCDITSPEVVEEAAKAIRERYGLPTILINNAGIAHAHTILEAKPSYLRKLFDVNVISHFYLIQAFLPDMIASKKGRIVTIASMASFVTAPGLVDYSATKAAALAIHEGLQTELKHRYGAPEIKTSVIHPFYARTALIDSFRASLSASRVPVIEPQQVADAVLEQVLSGRSVQVCLPAWMGIGALARGLPFWIQEKSRDDLKDHCLS